MAAVTLDAVSRESGVSKGGLLHHFPSRRALLDALFADMLSEMTEAIETAIDADGGRRGRFTRAYLDVVDRWRHSPDGHRQSAFWVLMLGDAALRARWSEWLSDRLDEHVQTDDYLEARAVRLASDGLWMSDLCAGPDSKAGTRSALIATLHGLL